MATIKSNVEDLSTFFQNDYFKVKVSDGLTFFCNGKDEDGDEEETFPAIVFKGNFTTTDGITSGYLTSIKTGVLGFDSTEKSLKTQVTFKNPIYVEDLVALKQSGKIGVQLLLSGDDVITGLRNGYAGNDKIFSIGGTINGGDGNDILVASKLADTLNGGSGIDTVSFEKATGSVHLSLGHPEENRGFAKGDTYIGVERFLGSKYKDNFTGGSRGDIFDGGAGDDVLQGKGGDDILIGGAGADTLRGGSGADRLTGGSGEDCFVFSGVSASNRKSYDTITDFKHGTDTIDVRDIDANEGKLKNNAFKLVDGDGPLKVGELHHFYSGKNTVVCADVDGDKKADFYLVLQGHIKLTSGDFLL